MLVRDNSEDVLRTAAKSKRCTARNEIALSALLEGRWCDLVRLCRGEPHLTHDFKAGIFPYMEGFLIRHVAPYMDDGKPPDWLSL